MRHYSFHTLTKLLLCTWSGFVVLCMLAACMGDEEYSTSPNDRLRFSTDTVNFDTIISGQPTSTYSFMVYNPAKKALRLSQVYLEKGTESDFVVNADGTYLEGGHAENLEIPGRDSLRVFLFANTPEQDSDEPVKTKDKLVFVTEAGVRQEVVLEAAGQAVIPLDAKVLLTDTLLDARRPYQIRDSLVVGRDATFTIGPGVRLYFHPKASLIVHGTVKAQGTVQAPIVMRGDRLENMFSQQSYDRIPGQWGGITLTGSSYGNHFDHCDIHSGTYGIRCDSSDVSREKLRLENSIVHNTSGDVLYARSSQLFVGNSQLTNAGGNCVTLRGGDANFVHCTIANFYAFAGGRGVALDYSNTDGNVRLPLYAAHFANCIITGYSSDEIMGSQSDRYKDDPFNYRFDHCLLCTPQAESEDIISCLWDNDKDGHAVWREENFAPRFDLQRLIFTFALDPQSQAVGTAAPDITRRYYPADRLGRERLTDGKSDMGCEKYVPQKEGDEDQTKQ